MMILRKQDVKVWAGFIWVTNGPWPSDVSCEHNNEILRAVKGG